MDSIGWIITETQFQPAQLHSKETVFTLGNGYLGTRGSFEEGYPGAMPATLINGVYDDVPIAYTELANCPDWLPLVVRVAGEYFGLNRGEILHYRRQLDMRRGILSREVRWRSPAGHTLDFYFERFVSLADEHILALRLQVTPVDFEGSIEIQAGLNGYSDNQGLRHWHWQEQGDENNAAWLRVRTRSSQIELGMAVQLTAIYEGERLPIQPTGAPGYPTLVTSFQAYPGERITLEKLVTVYTTRDTDKPVQAALDKLHALPNYATLRTAHEQAWESVWQQSDVTIEGDLKAQQAVRHSIFQLMAVAPYHDDRVGIPAKTLSGFAYAGHCFWDTEIFVLPLLTWTQPAIARNLLNYRYHTLPGARRKAKEAGFEGAMYAWESAGTGDEVTPRWVPPASGGKELVRIWCGDIELHINTDVAYAVWQYWQATGDDEWMRQYGAEMILDTAVFWGSRVETRDSASANPGTPCYEIRDVIGPDEYHDHVDNNAFTNCMVQWHLEKALSVFDWLKACDPQKAKQLQQQLHLTSEKLSRWVDIIERMWVSQDQKTGLIEQFEGFFKLEDIDLVDYEPRFRSMQALLGIEGANQRQVLKQADVLMLLYLLRDRYDRQTIQANWDYYNPRTDHTYGSSLGPSVHAILACEMGSLTEAYEHFMRAALVDVEDVRGNAGEGIHAASAGGVWQAVVFGFAGIKITESGPVANPKLPAGWTRLQFKLNWQGRSYEFDLQPTQTPVPVAQPVFMNPLLIPQTPIHAVIFDLDGVLTDTAHYHYLGWKQLADEEGIPFDEKMNEGMRGLARRDSLLYLLGDRQVPEAEMQAMMDRKNAYYVELIQGMTPADLLPGAVELLDELKMAGIKVALGSASKNARDVIQRLGIADKIDAIADGHSVSRSKPAPDLFFHAAQLLETPPAHCVVVEDAGAGVEGALAAGMWAVGLGPAQRVGQAHIVLPSLEGVFWDELLARLLSVAETMTPSDLVNAGVAG
jgi:beta-phosphoglucomutase